MQQLQCEDGTITRTSHKLLPVIVRLSWSPVVVGTNREFDVKQQQLDNYHNYSAGAVKAALPPPHTHTSSMMLYLCAAFSVMHKSGTTWDHIVIYGSPINLCLFFIWELNWVSSWLNCLSIQEVLSKLFTKLKCCQGLVIQMFLLLEMKESLHEPNWVGEAHWLQKGSIPWMLSTTK